MVGLKFPQVSKWGQPPWAAGYGGLPRDTTKNSRKLTQRFILCKRTTPLHATGHRISRFLFAGVNLEPHASNSCRSGTLPARLTPSVVAAYAAWPIAESPLEDIKYHLYLYREVQNVRLQTTRRPIETVALCRPHMDNIVDSLDSAYQEFISAAACVLEAKETSGGQKTQATDAALENFKQQWELFRVACDQAEEFVESVKQRIGSECLVDEATGSVATNKPGQPGPSGLPPISAVRLEQMSKAVRCLVIELQQGSGTGGGGPHPNSNAPFDARFNEDAGQ